MTPLLMLVSLSVQATECPDMYLAKREPMLIAPLAGNFFELCNSEYAVLVSEINKTALYSAEKLTPAQVKGAKRIKRGHNEFFEDYRLPDMIRVSSYSYSHTGYDRGHLAPAGDFSSQGTQKESFSLANVVPQSRVVNRGVWADIEGTVRHLADRGTVHVITGPLYMGPTRYLKTSGVPIPSDMFKAVYAPSSNVVGVYVVGNGDDERITKLSLSEFSNMTGIDVFPNLPAEVKKIRGAVPSP
ncbi:DNA/RNA non-specific endonuclease [Aeromonas salmonicida]